MKTEEFICPEMKKIISPLSSREEMATLIQL
jgi:hypothetical protein